MKQESVGDSLLEVAALLASAAASWAASYWVVKRDERRLSEEMLARAYAPATLACSVFLFQQIAVLVHFIRTRRSWKGLLLGLLWMAIAMVPELVVDAVFGAFLPD